jgi:hypothetical protein
MKKDKRCPCLVCVVQSNCTDYCKKFHFYRKLVLAETDFFISKIIDSYGKKGSKYMSQIHRDIDTAYKAYEDQEIDVSDEYFFVKNNIILLEMRFEITLANGRRASRGLSQRISNGHR